VSDISAAVRIEDLSPVKKRLSFDVPWSDVKNELDAVYKKVGRTAKIKGFRPGKIPRAILETYYREVAEEETVSNLVNRYYWDALHENKIPSVTEPEIEQKGIEQEKDFAFSATIEVEPVIEPKDYSGLHLEKEDAVVSDAEVETRLQEIGQMFATMEDIHEDRGIGEGDHVILDFAGSIEGKPIKDLTAENYALGIGSKTFIPGFEEQLIGIKKGETKIIALQFPETYHESTLAGKKAEFTVTIKGIRIKNVPEIDDKFIKNFEKYETLEALRADVRKSLEEEKRKKSDAEFERNISNQLLSSNEFAVPDAFIERQIYYMMLDTQRRMVDGGMDPKKAAEFSVKLHDQFKEEATRIVKTALLIRNIARKENLTVTEEELDAKIRDIASQRAQDYKTYKESLEKNDMIENIRGEILNQKAYDFLKEKATISLIRKDKTASQEAGK
jgi:trigger factor